LQKKQFETLLQSKTSDPMGYRQEFSIHKQKNVLLQPKKYYLHDPKQTYKLISKDSLLQYMHSAAVEHDGPAPTPWKGFLD
jgi:hypothetical protein